MHAYIPPPRTQLTNSKAARVARRGPARARYGARASATAGVDDLRNIGVRCDACAGFPAFTRPARHARATRAGFPCAIDMYGQQ
jgi:hypothetical protein